MSQNKLLTGLLVGAAVGVIVSLFDRNTRNDVMNKSKKATSNAKYYAQNRDELVSTAKQQAEKVQNLYSRISEDAAYVGGKVNELKDLTPHVKEMALETKEAFVDTKEALVESKEDVKAALKEDNPSPTTSLGEGNGSSQSGSGSGSSTGSSQSGSGSGSSTGSSGSGSNTGSTGSSASGSTGGFNSSTGSSKNV
ncbi:YtxH domain-containing protein [Planococcus sp. FY231025]|uniref:YtxH domain-containing protein n=1 Tax=Planococcus sp. FY231025 TaxID=3455699 RepID=UPI003F8ED11E